MATCPKCGSAVSEGSAFCSNCGASVSSTGQVPPRPPAGAASGSLSSNMAGALSYLLGPITGIIFLVLEPYNRDRFVRFHAFQSIFFCVGVILFQIIWGNILLGFFALGFLGWTFAALGNLVYLAFFLYWLFLFFSSFLLKQNVHS